jgi:hypothetical protein
MLFGGGFDPYFLKSRLLMKVFAIASFAPGITTDEVRKHLPTEVPATLKLYLEGKIEQFWFREASGPIFLMNVESVEQAKATLGALPLVAQDLMRYEFLPVTTLSPLGLLIQGK